MAIIRYEGQQQVLSAEELHALFTPVWDAPAEDVQATLKAILDQRTDRRYPATLARLRDLCAIITPLAETSTFALEWTSSDPRDLLITIQRAGGTKGLSSLLAGLQELPHWINPALILAVQLHLHAPSLDELLALQPDIDAAIAQGSDAKQVSDDILRALRALPTRPSRLVPVGF